MLKLRPKEWELLLALLERAPAVVNKGELQTRLWGKDRVRDGTLASTVFRLRQVLDAERSEGSYIDNTPGEGYRLAGEVWKETVHLNRPAFRRTHWALAAFLAVFVVGMAGLAQLDLLNMPLRNPTNPAPVTQITDDGYDKAGPLWPNGNRIYFTERVNGINLPAWVSSRGGPVTRMEVPGFAEVAVLDVRGQGPEFLLRGKNAQDEYYLWTWIPGEPARPLVASRSTFAAWTSDDAFVEETDGRLVYIDRGGVTKTISVPGKVQYLRWSASRRTLRYSLYDVGLNHTTLWEITDAQGISRSLREYPLDAKRGTWGASDRLFAFTVSNPKTSDIWVGMNEGHAAPAIPDKLIRLTEGPLDYDWPTPTSDNRRIFAIGTRERGELVSYQADKRRFVPYLDGRPACELDFTKDGRWLAYVKYRERTLWRSRADGTDAVQLTQLPLEAIEPHWSPDGSEIAFLGSMPNGTERIYLIPSQGGTPEAATLGHVSEGVPTWSPDGSTIVFGDLMQGKPESMSIHLLDVNRKIVTKLPGSDGLWSPRWSPDGAFISAVTPDFKRLRLYDCGRGVWEDLLSLDNIDGTTWSADSQFIYFHGVVRNRSLDAGPQLAIYRLDVHRRNAEIIADLDDFPMTSSYAWFGITPNGTPLGFRGFFIKELYSVNVLR